MGHYLHPPSLEPLMKGTAIFLLAILAFLILAHAYGFIVAAVNLHG